MDWDEKKQDNMNIINFIKRSGQRRKRRSKRLMRIFMRRIGERMRMRGHDGVSGGGHDWAENGEHAHDECQEEESDLEEKKEKQ